MNKMLRNSLIVTAYFAILVLLLPLQYYNIAAWPIVFSIICISIVWILPRAFGRSPAKDAETVIVGLAVIYLSVHYCTRVIGFCAWTDYGTLYVNRNDKSDTLVMNGYSCFLTDTDSQLFEERKITEHLKWVMPFDKKPIDAIKWDGVPPRESR